MELKMLTCIEVLGHLHLSILDHVTLEKEELVLYDMYAICQV